MGNWAKAMRNHILLRFAFGCTILIIMLSSVSIAGEIAIDVEKVLREIRQDQPVPAVHYLKKVQPINIDCVYYQGDYQGIQVAVETHPNSQQVASILLKIPGPDQTKQALPAVKRVIGSPRYSAPKKSEYGWEWSDYRTASVHYARGAKPGEGFTVISLFYR